jgi:DNA-binding SARP family transcriptional activator
MTPNQGVHLRVELLGRLDVRTETDREIRLTGRHAQALFGLLVLVRRPRSRETIAADLWPEAEANTAGSMRQALWLVRQALVSVGISPTDLLDIEGDTVGIRMDAAIELDTAALERCLDANGCGPEEAISRYRGDLLEGLGHDCFASERERLADRYEDALAVVAEQRLEAGDLDGARIAATRLLARDPLREEAHAVLIAVHGQIGSRSQVVRQYRRLSDVLSRELGERPLPDTEAIYRHALAQTMRRAQERAALIEPNPRHTLVAVGR